MKRVVIIATTTLFLISVFMINFAMAESAATIGKTTLQGTQVSSLKGRVYAQWADNPDGEVLFGILYWNTADPASGEPSGRASNTLDVRPPDPLFACCAWGYTGGAERNNPYAGWYNPGSTVRLKVKDKSLMDRIIKDAQNLVAMEVTLSGRTITGYKVLAAD